MTVRDLVEKVSRIITPETNNFFEDIMKYGYFKHASRTIIWPDGEQSIIRAPFDIRWLRPENLCGEKIQALKMERLEALGKAEEE